MNVIVWGFVAETPERGASPDYDDMVEVTVIDRRAPFAILARGYFERWIDVKRIRFYDARGIRISSHTRTSFSKVKKPPAPPRPRYKKKPARERKKKNPRTGWDAHRGRYGL